ncbi:SusC/RagA family TonB-linked outer membrane protein [Flavisolibacter nicotianae]|uniref:SusC/RagA family TonB-linked outer membrane protein n=1 Tax=Flavisolibacter nicotianae TaxID=2364882 RepID=UPI000EB541E0|nr:TonB-dependent receptor [Flavisolibacter nicotianae]
MKRRIYLSLLAAVCWVLAWGQARQVTGRVVSDSTNQPLSGVTVTVKGTRTASSSNNEGRFSITVPEKGNPVLVFSFVGYNSREVPLDGKTSVDVSLAATSTALDVVVIGYQVVRRRDLTSAVSSVTAKQLKDVPVNSAAEAIAGKLAGVQVNVSEGSPGADVDIFVRGRSSITQSGSPLYVVDGVQVENALSILSPQDIESIDVLKDAASTAIYGARGANGVILITTKGGKNTGGKTTVSYNAFVGYNKLSKKLDLMDPYNFVLFGYERAAYTGNPTDTAVATQYINRMSNFDTIANYKNVPGMDWQDRTMGRSAFQTTHNVSITGGTLATQYNLSLTYNKQQGLIANSDYDRKLASFRFDHKASERLKVGFNVRYNLQDVTGAGTSDQGGAGSNRLRQYIRYRPLLLPGQSDDFYDADLDARNPGNGLNQLNPLQLMNNEYRLRTITAYNFSGYANYNITKALQFRSTFGYNVSKTESRAFDDTLTANSRSNARMPLANWNNVDFTTINNSNVLNYSLPSIANSKHGLDVLVGHEIYQTKTRSIAQEVRFFPIGTKPDIAFANLGLASPPVGQVQPKPTSSEINTTQLSFFSRISYNFNRKYLLTLNFRADGSSLFGPDYSSALALKDSTNRKWGYFPSASAAWRFSQEDFMKNLYFITDAKLRLSYGTSGNNRLQAYGYTTGYAPPSNGGYGLNDVLNYTLVLPNRLGNPNITWESLTSENLGLDLSFFQNRLNLTADFYRNTTNDLLLENKIPPTSGYTTQYQNVGTIRNTGVELQLSGDVLRKKDFTWNANFNIAFNKNRIISLGSNQQFTANSGWFSSTNNPDDYILRVGDEVGTMYGLKVAGFYTVNDFTASRVSNAQFPNLTWQYTLDPKLADPSKVLADRVAPGQIKFEDVNGDGKITLDADRTVIGHALPKFTGGFNQQFSYKGFDASIFMNFSYGNQIFNANKLEFGNAYGVDANMLAIMNDRWKVIDQNGQLVQKEISNTVIGISPDSLAALNTGAKIWRPSMSTNGFAPMSFAVEDGSFLRINNVTLGYTLPARLLQRAKIASLRVYATVYNVATITGYSGYDPDVNARRGTPLTPGVDYAAYPRGRTFLAGINLNF